MKPLLFMLLNTSLHVHLIRSYGYLNIACSAKKNVFITSIIEATQPKKSPKIKILANSVNFCENRAIRKYVCVNQFSIWENSIVIVNFFTLS